MTALADVTEKTWQAQVIELARMLGWDHIYHTHDSRRSAPGFPDLMLLRERMVALELKSERGKLSPTQQNWVRALLEAGTETYVVRPSDLDALAKVLAHRGDVTNAWFTIGGGGPREFAWALRERTREECRT